ncbi:unnamed protein product [Aureobasidium vineae]|uniref:F-box domain-containing protein n=1 Tax=Aureobasidium vineae TaxID=2773715 RepID=A0A9N8JL47_9PEZI|nr:unnamed protein product [Aureobasidium vineae]
MTVTINNFPNEILLEILQDFDYYDLKKCMRANKAFNAIIKHTAFDRVLFRSANVIGKDGIIKYSTFATHPALKRTMFPDQSPNDQIELRWPHNNFLYDPPKYLLQNKVADEQVTSPPVSYVRVKPYQVETRVEVENPNGITIRQLHEAMCSVYEDPDTTPPLVGSRNGKARMGVSYWLYPERGGEFSPHDLLLERWWDELSAYL